MGSLVLAEPEISLFGRKTVQRLTMAFHRHLLLAMSVLLLFSILAVSAERQTMTCSFKRDANGRIVADGRTIAIDSDVIIGTGTDRFGGVFSPWDPATLDKRGDSIFKIPVPSSAVTSTRRGNAIAVEECYIDYHGPSQHNNGDGSVGSTWCHNCRGDDRKQKDKTNTIGPRVWRQARPQLTDKLRQLVGDYPPR